MASPPPSPSIQIRTFSQCPPSLQMVVAAALFAEWPEDFELQGVNSLEGAQAAILKNYAGWDSERSVFYVATAPASDGSGTASTAAPFIGTISVQYDMNSPYAPSIANVFVYPSLRSFGFGKILVHFAERWLKKKGLSNAYLWCDVGLKPYYERLGYKNVDTLTAAYKPVEIMAKSLPALNPTIKRQSH